MSVTKTLRKALRMLVKNPWRVILHQASPGPMFSLPRTHILIGSSRGGSRAAARAPGNTPYLRQAAHGQQRRLEGGREGLRQYPLSPTSRTWAAEEARGRPRGPPLLIHSTPALSMIRSGDTLLSVFDSMLEPVLQTRVCEW